MIAPMLSSIVMPRIAVDTNVIVAAMIRVTGTNRSVLRACLEGRARPIIGEALFLEYEDVLARPRLMARSPLSATERRRLLEAFLSVCDWMDIYFSWRPNLRDEGDNHVIELAVAGGARWIVTNNVADFRGAELRFPQIRAAPPGEFIREAIA
jgi:putative PIN family toxin of toxin-antitoxin system